jgi:hypothetical protein
MSRRNLRRLFTCTIGFTLLAFVGPLGVTGAAGAAKKNPATYTCAELISLDVEYIPHAIYWIDGFHTAGGDMVEVSADYFDIPEAEKAEIIAACKKNPEKPAAEVIKQTRDKHKQ